MWRFYITFNVLHCPKRTSVEWVPDLKRWKCVPDDWSRDGETSLADGRVTVFARETKEVAEASRTEWPTRQVRDWADDLLEVDRTSISDTIKDHSSNLELYPRTNWPITASQAYRQFNIFKVLLFSYPWIRCIRPYLDSKTASTVTASIVHSKLDWTTVELHLQYWSTGLPHCNSSNYLCDMHNHLWNQLLIHSVNILFTLLLVQFLVRISLHHNSHFYSITPSTFHFRLITHCSIVFLVSFRLSSRISDLEDRTNWALPFVCFSFIFYKFLVTCARLSWQHSAFQSTLNSLSLFLSLSFHSGWMTFTAPAITHLSTVWELSSVNIQQAVSPGWLYLDGCFFLDGMCVNKYPI